MTRWVTLVQRWAFDPFCNGALLHGRQRPGLAEQGLLVQKACKHSPFYNMGLSCTLRKGRKLRASRLPAYLLPSARYPAPLRFPRPRPAFFARACEPPPPGAQQTNKRLSAGSVSAGHSPCGENRFGTKPEM